MRHRVTQHRTTCCHVCIADGDACKQSDADQHAHTANRDPRKHSDADRNPHPTDSYPHTADVNPDARHRHRVRLRL